jgi:hypothetical protein
MYALHPCPEQLMQPLLYALEQSVLSGIAVGNATHTQHTQDVVGGDTNNDSGGGDTTHNPPNLPADSGTGRPTAPTASGAHAEPHQLHQPLQGVSASALARLAFLAAHTAIHHLVRQHGRWLCWGWWWC